jgi:hypothetical protein
MRLGSKFKKAEVEEQKRESDYADCLLISSSAGIAERLWSKFDALVDQRRNGTSPVMIEAILFLKENRDLWSFHDVRTALKKFKKNEKRARFEARLAAQNLEQTQIAADMEMRNVRDDE